MKKKLIAGNWKMHGQREQLVELEAIAAVVTALQPNADVIIHPPATLIDRSVQSVAGRIGIGGQDCHWKIDGSFTGDISAQMLKDMGATSVIVGHSERRRDHAETNDMVAAKVAAAWQAGLMVIICIGESQAQRENGTALSACTAQLNGSLPDDLTTCPISITDATAIAYEPLWAIGSGHIPSDEQITQMHAHIRQCLEDRCGPAGKNVRILYGGSVVPANAQAILKLPEVNGALIGGASLNAEEFDVILAGIPAVG